MQKELIDYKRFKMKIKNNQKITLKISAVGDCTLGTDEDFPYINSFPYRFELENRDYEYFFSDVKSTFFEDDLTIANLETTFTKASKKAIKKFNFKGDPSYSKILKAGGVDIVNISNNHIYDYLNKGYKDTILNLKKEGILYSGEGKITYYYVKGITIAGIGYLGWNKSIKDKIFNDIKTAKDKADIVIISFHWGEERSNYPNDIQRELGRYSIDMGGDLVIGHHPHVIQGIEFYKSKYIVYSLGNFSFGGNRNPRDKDTFIFKNIFTINKGAITDNKMKIIPCSISSRKNVNDYRPTILHREEKKRVLDRIYKYSSKLKYGIKYISNDNSKIRYHKLSSIMNENIH